MRNRLFNALHRLVMAYPRTLVMISLVMATLAGFYGVGKMEMITDQDRLLSEDLGYHARYMDFLRCFGDLEFLYILIEGPTQESMIAFADDLDQYLRSSDDIQDVIYQFDSSWAKDYALYYDDVSRDDLTQLRDELASNQQEVSDLFTIQSVDEVLSRIAAQIDISSNNALPNDTTHSDNLGSLLQALQGKSDNRLGDISRLHDEIKALQVNEIEYNWTSGKKSLLMFVLPAKDYSTLSVIEKPLQRIRTDIGLTIHDHPGVTAGVTGRPALQADEMSTTNDDMKRASITALIFVTVLFVFFFRELSRPLCGIVALLCAMGWTYGFVALTLGHLNLLSLVFALILIGLGIDFGIHFLHRYQEELSKSGNPSDAILQALHHAGSGIITGAVTSSIAFLLALFTGFLGLAELGYVAGIGIVFCLIAMLLTLPAMLVTYDKHVGHRKRLPIPVHLVGLRHVSRYPRLMIAVIVLASVGMFPQALNVTFDDNLLKLQADGLESVEYEHKLIEESEHSTWYCAFIEPALSSVRNTVSRLELCASVAGVESIADALPDTPPEQIKLIQQIRQQLGPIHQQVFTPYYPSDLIYPLLQTRLKILFNHLDQLERYRERLASTPDLDSIPQSMRQEQPVIPEISPSQQRRFDQLRELESLLSGTKGVIEKRLQNANRILLEEPRDSLQTLARLVHVDPPTLNDLPETLSRLFVGNDGSLLVMAYPKEDIWQTELMKTFITDMREIDPDVTGTPVQVYESGLLMRDSFYHIGFYSIIAVAVLVFLDFLSLKAIFFVNIALMLGVLWLVEIMGFLGISLNLANFFAIPILIGIGVDDAVHFYHRYQETRDVEQSMFTTGTTLTLTTLTTVVGFGSLVFASHKGLASLGALMAIGSVTCWFACVVFMPTLIKLFGEKKG